MCPSLFGSSVLISSLLLSGEFPPLSSERGACTPLVDSQLTLKGLCWFPPAGHHGAGLIHPLPAGAFTVYFQDMQLLLHTSC